MDSILRNLGLTLPITNPVLIFSLVLFVLLLTPILQQRFKIPNIIGLIFAGLILGENGLGVLSRDQSFELFGTVGLVYIMFLAGLEMDLSDFKKNRRAGISFGMFTFFIPMILGVVSSVALIMYLPEPVVKVQGVQPSSEMTHSYYLVISAILLSSMYASHTLLSYPTVSKYGVNKNRSISITIGGTMITTSLSLLVLAVIVGMAKGEINGYFWVRLGIAISVFLFVIIYVFPKISSFFFKKYSDSITQYIFVLALVFLGGYLAQISGLEAIIGAFMVGLSINKFIPRISPLMNRLEFVGNAIFIPFFLIGVGMLIDLRTVFNGANTLVAALVMCTVACSSKYFAARITQKLFHLSRNQGLMIFGLSNAQAAATLAAVKIGYDTVVLHTDSGETVRLFGDDILNGTIVMILVTCTISSFVTERAARKMAVQSETLDDKIAKVQQLDRVLIPLSNPNTISSLMEIAVLLKLKASKEPLYVLHVASDSSRGGMDYGKNLLEKAARIASATDNTVKMISRYDANVASGIVHTVKEQDITEVVLGLHHKANIADSFFGDMTEEIMLKCNQMAMIVKSVQPINTINRIVIAVPAKAEFEIGFVKWYDRVKNICKQIGARASFFAPESTLEQIKVLAKRNKFGVTTDFNVFDDWEDFLILTRELQMDDLFVIITSRKDALSYNPAFEKLPTQLSKYFADNSFIVLYPEQYISRTEVELNELN